MSQGKLTQKNMETGEQQLLSPDETVRIASSACN
jgi:hypothetical protein